MTTEPETEGCWWRSDENVRDQPQVSAVQVGDKAPDVSFPDSDGRPTSLSQLKGEAALICFVPEDWDPSRRHHLELFNQTLEKIEGMKLLGVNMTGAWCHADIQGEGTVNFPMLRTDDPELAKAFGVEGRQAVFVLDANGIVRWSHVAPAGVYPTPDQIVQAVESVHERPGVSRRQFLVTALAASFALTVLPRTAKGAEPITKPAKAPSITLNVNGKNYEVEAEPRMSLLDALRERIGLTGTKKGCDHGQCGACTVHVNGRRVNSCLMLAMQAEGEKITTVEGLSNGPALHQVQEAFIAHDGFQCGYCTPGQIMSAVACIHEGHTKTNDEITEWMSGNICRCGAYIGIREAVKEAAKKGAR